LIEISKVLCHVDKVLANFGGLRVEFIVFKVLCLLGIYGGTF
jgi:hypothetical protein